MSEVAWYPDVRPAQVPLSPGRFDGGSALGLGAPPIRCYGTGRAFRRFGSVLWPATVSQRDSAGWSEELQCDVVRITERHPGAIRSVNDAAIDNPKLIQSRFPFRQL